MSTDNPFIDEAGDQVLRFVSAAHNLSRLGELTDEVVTIAKSEFLAPVPHRSRHR